MKVNKVIGRFFVSYLGVKTGFTASAGGCLCSITSVYISKYERQDLLIVVLGCKDAESRFRVTKALIEEYHEYRRMMKL
jgi:D-alanyl-D-alanine carboxypeptidase